MVAHAMERVSETLLELEEDCHKIADRFGLKIADGEDVRQTAYLAAHERCQASPGFAKYLLELPGLALRALTRRSLVHAAVCLQQFEPPENEGTGAVHDLTYLNMDFPSPWEIDDAKRVIARIQGLLSRTARFAFNVTARSSSPEALAPVHAIPTKEADVRFHEGMRQLAAIVRAELRSEFGEDVMEEFTRLARIHREYC